MRRDGEQIVVEVKPPAPAPITRKEARVIRNRKGEIERVITEEIPIA